MGRYTWYYEMGIKVFGESGYRTGTKRAHWEREREGQNTTCLDLHTFFLPGWLRRQDA